MELTVLTTLFQTLIGLAVTYPVFSSIAGVLAIVFGRELIARIVTGIRSIVGDIRTFGRGSWFVAKAVGRAIRGAVAGVFGRRQQLLPVPRERICVGKHECVTVYSNRVFVQKRVGVTGAVKARDYHFSDQDDMADLRANHPEVAANIAACEPPPLTNPRYNWHYDTFRP